MPALGATTAVFQWEVGSELFGVHTPGPLLPFLPLLLTGVLFGLAMDYQLFMVSGMREAYAHGESERRAVTAGFRNGRVVVSAAAIIMIAVFGGFGLPITSPMLRPPSREPEHDRVLSRTLEPESCRHPR